MLSHVSASSIKLFKSCPRRWYERYILDKKEPTSKAMARGTAVHKHLEDYLLQGLIPDDSIEGKIAKAGLQHLPEPQGKFKVELSLEHIPLDSTPVPFKGFIDLLIGSDIPEVLDHKTTSNFKYALTSEQLGEDTQLIIYAKHVLAHCDADAIKLTHVCYLTKAPYKSQYTTALVTRAQVDDRFEAILETVNEMLTASELPVSAIDKNKSHCWAYGKRCPYFDDCQRTIKSKDVKNMSEAHLSVIDKLRGESKKVAGDATLYVNCMPLNQPVIPLANGLDKLISQVCKAHKVAHISHIQYAQGYDYLSELILKEMPAGHFYINSRSPLYEKCSDALHTACKEVVLA